MLCGILDVQQIGLQLNPLFQKMMPTVQHFIQNYLPLLFELCIEIVYCNFDFENVTTCCQAHL